MAFIQTQRTPPHAKNKHVAFVGEIGTCLCVRVPFIVVIDGVVRLYFLTE